MIETCAFERGSVCCVSLAEDRRNLYSFDAWELNLHDQGEEAPHPPPPPPRPLSPPHPHPPPGVGREEEEEEVEMKVEEEEVPKTVVFLDRIWSKMMTPRRRKRRRRSKRR